MPAIKVLPSELVSKIAAGEVVERPSSVVKELVENSIDAGAKNITVEIDLGGAALIRVIDDGSGMSPEDARLAVAHHATSKIDKFEDLYSLNTHGFRGEALASIAAVSQFGIQTKRVEDLAGTELNRGAGLSGSQDWQSREVGCNTGTQITVKNIFYNVPARRKFLRSAMTEYQHILSLLESFGLIWPEIGFKFISNGRTILDWPLQTWKDRCREILGDVFKDFFPINYAGDFKMTGWLGRPAVATPQRNQYLFINNRVVSEHMVARAIKEAYGDLIAKDCLPAFVLKFDLPPENVDVNVHPRKTEVKIVENHKFYRAVFQIVRSALVGAPPRAAIQANQPTYSNGEVTGIATFSPMRSAPQPLAFSSSQNFQTIHPGVYSSSALSAKINPDRLIVLGQLDNSYILTMDHGSVWVFDQHAADERIKYEQLKRSGLSQSQNLLQPITLDLSLSEFNTYRVQQAVLASIGWQTEGFGERTILVRAVPTAMRPHQSKAVLTELLKDLSVSDSPDNLWKSMACHSAMRFGDKLTLEEQRALITRAVSERVQSCPHGRPIVHQISLDDLHKIFKRRGF